MVSSSRVGHMVVDEHAGITVYTRFSVRQNRNLPTREWIESRFALLNQITLPSLNLQLYENFVWLIGTSPEWYSKTVALFETINIRPGIHVEISTIPVPQTILNRVHPDARSFITIRLDSDDAFHRETLTRLAEHSSLVPDNHLINLPNGVQLDWSSGRMLYFRYHSKYQGPFFAVKHLTRDKMFALGGHHRQARNHFNGVYVLPDQSWLQVVHGGNLANSFVMPGIIEKMKVWFDVNRMATMIPVPKKNRTTILRNYGLSSENSTQAK